MGVQGPMGQVMPGLALMPQLDETQSWASGGSGQSGLANPFPSFGQPLTQPALPAQNPYQPSFQGTFLGTSFTCTALAQYPEMPMFPS